MLGKAVDKLCTCGYILPSRGYIDPEDHGEACLWRKFVGMITNDDTGASTVRRILCLWDGMMWSEETDQRIRALEIEIARDMEV